MLKTLLSLVAKLRSFATDRIEPGPRTADRATWEQVAPAPRSARLQKRRTKRENAKESGDHGSAGDSAFAVAVGLSHAHVSGLVL